ncbi:MAG TPA: class I SAM-dependent methyltransferase [Anaeromyxobacteraceae bacterium]|nr:class I SAM-dependent methyltransferase [Anaeromyxobacteraceae bacterium]
MRVTVTTSQEPSRQEEASARAAASARDLPFAARGKRPLAEVAAESGAEALLVLSPRRAGLWLDGVERWWDPGMGALRLKRLDRGEPPAADPFLAAAGIRPGERILDCTLGLGADALVAAGAAGPDGSVLGVEASPALAALVAEGLARLPHPAARRIEVRAGDAAALLAGLPPRSFDLVCFDPMFRHARAEPPGFDLVRRLADQRPLEPETLLAARRVARRAVLVKDGAPGWDLARLGLEPLPSARGAKRYYARLGPV